MKPVFSTLLFFAVEEGKVRNVNQKLRKLGWPLVRKDRAMTFADLANMISGYARPEKPGEAWAYNDYAIQLYQKSLFDSVFRMPPNAVLLEKLAPLQFEDNIRLREDKPRLIASARDFARIGLFWLHRGNWNGLQLLPQKYFDKYLGPYVPRNLKHTQKGDHTHNDYLKIGTFGGGSDHFTDYGSGIYGFNWWFNAKGRLHPETSTWPDATPETFMAIGAGGNVLAIIPEHNLILVSARGMWGEMVPGDTGNAYNHFMKMLLSSLSEQDKF